MLQSMSIPLHRNPALRPGLAALVEWLMESSYSAHAIGRIFDWTATQGTPTGCPELATEDEYGASSVFCDALDLVPYSSDAWSDESIPLDVELLAMGVHPVPFQAIPPELEDLEPLSADAPDASPYCRFPGVLALPPLCGGSPEFEPSDEDRAAAAEMFADEPARPGPSAADWAEYRARFDAIEPMYGYE
jgi:hypothetical protein